MPDCDCVDYVAIAGLATIERIPLRAEAEKLLEVGAYLAYLMRKMGMAGRQHVTFPLSGFGTATVALDAPDTKITLEFSEGAWPK